VNSFRAIRGGNAVIANHALLHGIFCGEIDVYAPLNWPMIAATLPRQVQQGRMRYRHGSACRSKK
jgi:hypothetical protein